MINRPGLVWTFAGGLRAKYQCRIHFQFLEEELKMPVFLRLALAAAALCVVMTGCAGVGTTTEADATPQSATAVKAQPDKEGWTKVAPPPATAEPPKEQLTVDEIKKRREMERKLERDLDAFYKHMIDRNVDKASRMVEPEFTDAMKKRMWRFIGKYTVENYEVIENDIDFAAEPPFAKTIASLTVYEKHSVAPKRKEFFVCWHFGGEEWVVCSETAKQ